MKQSNKKKAVAYCRVANSMDNPFQIRQQERRVHAFAKEHGYTIGAVYLDNDYSGLTMERPGLQRLIRDIEDGKVKHVLMTDLPRLSRNYLYPLVFLDLCDQHNVVVRTVEDGGRDVRTPHDALLALIAEFCKRQKVRAAK